MSFIEAKVSTDNEEEAHRIANHLVEKRLCACANIFPCKSVYWWKGKIEKEKEFFIVFKTTKEKWEQVKEEIIKMHSYELPGITRLEIESNNEFEEWVKEETRN